MNINIISNSNNSDSEIKQNNTKHETKAEDYTIWKQNFRNNLKNIKNYKVEYKDFDLSFEIVKKINDRELFNLKNAENKKFDIDEIIYLAKFEDKYWEKANNRKLFSILNSENKPFGVNEILILAKINDKTWNNIDKRNLLTESKVLNKSLTARDIKFLGSLSDNDYELTLKSLKMNENANKPAFFVYETLKGKHPEMITSDFSRDTIYRSSLVRLDDKNYEKTNNELYGEKLPEVQMLYKKFKDNYPDIELTFDNDVSYDRAKTIINATKIFIDFQRANNAPYVKKIQFTKMDGSSGFFNDKNKDKIWINIQGGMVQFLSSLTHENGHYKDYIERGLAKKEIPEDIIPILKKVFGNYAATKSYESIAELAKAIETPYDCDETNMTKKIRLRKDYNGNMILMIMKNNDITEDEVNKLGNFFKEIECPELISDYKKSMHGSPDLYYETVIRTKK